MRARDVKKVNLKKNTQRDSLFLLEVTSQLLICYSDGVFIYLRAKRDA